MNYLCHPLVTLKKKRNGGLRINLHRASVTASSPTTKERVLRDRILISPRTRVSVNPHIELLSQILSYPIF